jgi:hypothetical protein
LPGYLKVKEMLNGIVSLNRFLSSIRQRNLIYEEPKKGGKLESLSAFSQKPLNKYLDEE